LTDYDLLRVAGNDPDRRARTVYVMKRMTGDPATAQLELIGTAQIVPDLAPMQGLAGEFAFSTRVPCGTVGAAQIVVIDDLGTLLKPRSVSVNSMNAVTGPRGA
jgi:hypothetical protein